MYLFLDFQIASIKVSTILLTSGAIIRIETNTIGHAIANDDGQICINFAIKPMRKPITVADTIIDVKNDMTNAKQYTRYRNEIFIALAISLTTITFR